MSVIADIDPAPGVRVRFLSDLHYGHERCEAPPPRELAPLLEGIGMLVIAGDLAETRSCSWQSRGYALREELRQLCRERGVELVEISGNHDPDVPFLLARFWGGRVVAMHGHALYKEVAPWSWEYLRHKKQCQELIARYPDSDINLESRLALSRAMCQFTPPILRRGGVRNPLLRGFLHCFWPPQRPLGIIRCWLTCGRRAEQFARQFFPEAETLILGHFHRPGCWRYGAHTILNTGAWFRHASPRMVDMQDGKLLFYGPIPRRLRDGNLRLPPSASVL